jgi:hypothetical protein
MAEVLSYAKQEYPAALTPIGSDDGIPASGYFSLHFTYPDTAYEDPTTMTFAKDGANQLGINYMIRTPLAGDSTNAAATGEDARNGTNTVVIDLKRAAEAHAASIAAGAVMPAKTFDLGTEEAARLIAATINSTRNRQIGAHSRSRYLRARYVKMSGSKQYGGWYSGSTLGRGMLLGFENGQRIGSGSTYLKASGNFATTVHEITTNVGATGYLLPNENLYTTNNEFIGKILEVSGTRIRFYEPIKVALTASSKLRGGWLRLIQFGTTTERDTVNASSSSATGWNHNLIPTDMPKRGTIVGNPNTNINDSAGADVSNYTLTYDGWEIVNDKEVQFNITKVESTSAIKDITDSFSTDPDDPTWLVNNDTEEQHTVVVSWEIDAPTGGGYWGTANGGPVVQGLGASLPVWYLTAKPMDGGNMGLPAANADSRGASPSTHTTGHGYSRFSIEGLNSCSLPDMPPPDKPFDGPVVAGSTEADPFQWTGLNTALNAHQEDNLLITKSEFGTQMDDGGPFQTNCMVSTNANITGGTTIKLLTPATKISSQFNDGDVIYAADKTALGTIAAGGIAETTNTALTVVGPKSVDSGVRVDHGFGNTLNGDPPLGGNRCYNAGTFYAWYHATGSLSTLRTGGVAPNSFYEPGDEITDESDNLIGSVPICRTVKRQAPGAGGTIGSRVHIADGNDLFSDANRDIKSFTVDINDPNLIYHVGEKLYAEDIYYKTMVTTLPVPQANVDGSEMIGVHPLSPTGPTSAGYEGQRIKQHDRIYKLSGGNMTLIGTVKTVADDMILLKGHSATTLADGEDIYVHAYIGTIKSMQETQHRTSVYGFLSGTVANNSSTTLNFSTNDTTIFTRRVLPGSLLETNSGTLVGRVSSVGDRSITLEANNAVALNANTILHVRGNSEWAIELEDKLHFDNGAGHIFYNDVANTTATGTFRLIDDLRLRAESVTAQSITISNLAADGSGDSSLSGTILRNLNRDQRLFTPAVNYEAGVNNQGALNTQAADWKYLKTHHDDGNNTGSRYLIVKSTAGVKSIDKETYGGSLMMNYADALNGNPATLIGEDGKEYGTISSVLDERAVTVQGTTFTYSRIKLATCVADIPEGTVLHRAAPTITLTSAISGNTLRHGQMLFKGKDINKWQVALENGHKINSRFPKWNNAYGDQHEEITSLTNSDIVLNKAVVKNGLKSEVSTITASTVAHTGSQGYVHRPFRTVRAVNTERVKGLHIPNEAMVWENIQLVDDTGAELTLEGGSPFGTVIKDYNYKQNRIDPKTNTASSLPSTPGSGLEPNLEIQLPSQDEIPGNIIVRSGHDRVQAWRHLSWGMGGLSIPRPDEPGVIEAGASPYDSTAGEATQFDTNDRVLHFHPVRILHDTLTSQFGLSLNNTPGAVPSGSTRMFAAHRLSDHTERGSVLPETQNGAVQASNIHAHHRIRFGRQGHHFVSPITIRGTPMSLRRQLHRSHGSAYSLMFEAETENKHFGFQSGHNDSDANTFFLDTMEVKGSTLNTGSFSADGLPHAEIENNGLPNHHRFFNAAPNDGYDVLFAPGQEHTLTEGGKEQVHFVASNHGKELSNFGGYGNAAHSAAVALELASSRVVNNRFTAGEEFTINGFFVNQYLLMGGRPRPALRTLPHERSQVDPYGYTYNGHPAGWHQPRVGTELATVPPLIAHDPEMVNASATAVAIVESPSTNNQAHFTQVSAHNDLALVSGSDTNSGATPDAFLCTWLAEYSHPALFGTSREQYMTFRYRTAGMPKAVNNPAVRGLMLRNAHSIGSQTAGTPKVAMPFERLYAFQWLQNYGYNGLNAGGHGANWGTRAASAVLMGHSTIREPHGTLELRPNYVYHAYGRRKSRGEGIGDGLNPYKVVSRTILDQDATNSQVWNEVTTVENAMVAVDWSRRLPVRAWGFRTGSDALNMLAGDPAETLTTQQKIQASGRFDGGKHDTMNTLPVGNDWQTLSAYTGVERTVPIGVVMSEHTNEGYDLEGFTRLSNKAWEKGENPAGMGRVLDMEDVGLVKPNALPAGLVHSHRTEFTTVTGTSAKFLHAKSLNTGSDPIIGLNHHSGDATLAAGSVEAVTQSTAFGGGSTFIHHKGNNLHLNAHPVDHKVSSGDLTHFPAHGWGRSLNMKNKNEAERGTMPIPLSEIADHRQVQSDLSPRLGMVVETESERTTGKNEEYIVTSTKAVSLHSDLAVGQQFPLTPSWVQQTKWTKFAQGGQTAAAGPDGTYGGQLNPNQMLQMPQWSLNRETLFDAPSNSDTVRMFDSKGVQDHWAVRGCGDLPAWGGVYILRKTWLERPENDNNRRSVMPYDAADSLHQQSPAPVNTVDQPVRKTADYIMRMVRPLKVFGFSTRKDWDNSDHFTQDGWLLGAYNTLTASNKAHQPFTRDKRYGMFELNQYKMPGTLEPIASRVDTAPTMAWPDANDRDVTWHLIPSANMLQHFKSDAARRDGEGSLVPSIDPRYSQSTHPGGKHVVSQTETQFTTQSNLALMDPYNRRGADEKVVKEQADLAMTTLGPKQKISIDGGSYMYVKDATVFPATGTLVIIGLTGQLTYTARDEQRLTISTDPALSTGQCHSIGDLAGYEVYFGKNSASTAATVANIYPSKHSLVVAPSFVDNAVSMGLSLPDKWDATDSGDTQTFSPNIAYRGIGHYEPSDFNMLTPQRFVLNDGAKEGIISYVKQPGTGGLSTVYADGKALSATNCPPYLIDAIQKRWRIAGADVVSGEGTWQQNLLKFRNINGDSLSGGGMSLGKVRLGHYMAVGVRTTDAALMMLNDIGTSLPGADLIPYESVIEPTKKDTALYDYGETVPTLGYLLRFKNEMTLSAALNAHPSLLSSIDHSSVFVSRDARGIGVLDTIRSLSQMDGRQLLLDETGRILYSGTVFVGRDKRIGSSSGPQTIEVSSMLEMANHVIVEGDKIAENERVRAEVKDLEKAKMMGGEGNEEGVLRTATQMVPGLKEPSMALRMAKQFMNRTESGASMLRVGGLVKASHIQPGEIINVDFTNEGVKGQFAVFEATTNSTTGFTDLVIGQYEKGIEGILADLLSSTAATSQEDPSRLKERMELSLTGSVRLVAASRVRTRLVNNTRLIIGGRWRGGSVNTPLGAIGLKGGATGVVKNGAINATSTTAVVVDGVDATTRFAAGDRVYTLADAYVGLVQSVSATQITLTANNAVAIADNIELRVKTKRADPVGHSKSVFYEVR